MGGIGNAAADMQGATDDFFISLLAMNQAKQAAKGQKYRAQEAYRASQPGPYEQAYVRGQYGTALNLQDLMNEILSQSGELTPELYQLMGFQPEVTERFTRDQINESQQKAIDLQKKVNDAEVRLAQLKGIRQKDRTKKISAEIKSLRKQRNSLIKEAELATTATQNMIANRQSITPGKRATIQDILSGRVKLSPETEAYIRQQEELRRAVAGETALNPEFEQGWRDRERVLRATLAQQLGSGYEASSIGQRALQEFAQQKSEATFNYRQSERESLTRTIGGGAQNLGRQVALWEQPFAQQRANASSLADMFGMLGQGAEGRAVRSLANAGQMGTRNQQVFQANAMRDAALINMLQAGSEVGQSIMRTAGSVADSYMGSPGMGEQGGGGGGGGMEGGMSAMSNTGYGGGMSVDTNQYLNQYLR